MLSATARGARFARAAAWTAASVAVALYFVYPSVMGVVAVWPADSAVGPPPAGFEEVSLTARDGTTRAAWYAPPKNGAAIVLVHGAGGNRTAVRRYATMLAGHGYGVLSIDLRGHGESEGGTNRLGWGGTDDVKEAVAFLRSQPGVDSIGGVGTSLGGEVLLGAASASKDIEAIVADGATHRCLSELTALPSERSLPRTFTARVMFVVVDLLSGDDPPEPPLMESMRLASGTRFLLVAGGDEADEVAYGREFGKQVGDRLELWVVPGAGHVGAYAARPDDYERRVLSFLDAALLR